MSNKLKLDIQSKSLIEIEVNGGVIHIDGTDVDLPKKVESMVKTYNDGVSKLKSKEVINRNKNLSEKELDEEQLKDIISFVSLTHKSIDELFGKGASKKIFPIRTIGSLESFFEQIPSLFEMIGVKTNDYIQTRLSKRDQYAPSEESVDGIEDLD